MTLDKEKRVQEIWSNSYCKCSCERNDTLIGHQWSDGMAKTFPSSCAQDTNSLPFFNGFVDCGFTKNRIGLSLKPPYLA